MTGVERSALDHALEQALSALALERRVITYRDLAAQLGLDGPGRINKLTQAIESLMEDEFKAGAPLRAALVISRGGSGLPARGFFDKARELGLYSGSGHEADARQFHQLQLDALFLRARR